MNLAATFDSLTLIEIENFIAQSQEEHLTLDFKGINNAELTHSDDKKHFAIALSGFANSSGGIIIWGVDARKNSNGIDSACAKKEIVPVQRFLTRLNEHTGNAVSPIVEGVRHKAIMSSENSGFAATFVPASDSGPHMAKFSENRYFKRSGSSFRQMEHFDLEDMFGRRQKPNLFPQAKQHGQGLHDGTIRFVISLTNNGRGLACFPYLSFKLPPTWNVTPLGLDGNGTEGLSRLTSADQSAHSYGAGSETVIHPGTIRDVCAIVFSPTANQQLRSIRCEVAAEGMRLREMEMVVSL